MPTDAYAPPMPPPIPPGNLGRAQAAERLGVSLTWFDTLVRKGQLTKRGNRLTRTVWFDESEVDELARKRTEETAEAEE